MTPSANTPPEPSNDGSGIEDLIRLVGARAMERLKQERQQGKARVSETQAPGAGSVSPSAQSQGINSVETEQGARSALGNIRTSP
jgi:hypothetical protein